MKRFQPGRSAKRRPHFLLALCAAVALWAVAPVQAQPRDAQPGYGRPAHAPAPRIWFSPLDPHFRSDFFHAGLGDFDQLFAPGAPWADAAAHVRVFKVSLSYVIRGSDPEIRSAVLWIEQHHMQLALEAPMLTAGPDCGHIEGYGSNQTITAVQRLARLGARLDILAGGESLWFGHFYNGRSACHTPIPALVANVVQTAQQVRAVFPAIRIADIEPISNFNDPNWVGAIGQWLQEFQREWGAPYAGVQLDIAWWQAGWQPRALAITTTLRRVGMPVGVIFNGNSPEKSDLGWIREAEQNWRAFEALAGPPNDAIFQSWEPQPDRNLPESAPDAFTSALLDYEANHPGT